MANVPMDEDPLSLSAEQMRQMGYQTVDMLVDWLSARDHRRAVGCASPSELARRLRQPPPQAEDFDQILGKLNNDVLPFMVRTDHPRHFAFVPGCGTWPAALGDFIASACNVYTGSWLEGSGPSQVELVVLDWFKEWIGYPDDAAGVLVSGGSAANMTALACARETLLGAMSDRVVVYVSDQGHSSLARAARALGFRPEQVRVLPVDQHFRMRPDALLPAMDADLQAGRQPLFVAANAGSTNTGAIDPLPALAAICRDRGVWLHVDGAYGGFAALTDRGKTWLAGIELADSVTLDPHKWLSQPYECGCLLVRHGRQLREAFEITPDYLKETEVKEQEVNFSDLGLQLTRMFRALKVWMSFKYFGVDAFRAAIDRTLDLAQFAQARIEASQDLEILNPASMSVVCFRRKFAGVDNEDELARLNAALLQQLTDSGEALISSTRLHGRYALRLCIVNHTSSDRDVEQALEWIERAPAPRLTPAQPVETYERHPDVMQPWLERQTVDVSALQALPLFQGLSHTDLQIIAHSAYRDRAVAGDTIVRQWEVSSEFYVIMDGTADVYTAGECIDQMGPGSFFGELAAMDWGASFGYPRLASVIATSPMELLVLPGASFRTIMRDAPAFGDRIRAAVRERLPRL